MKVLVWFFKIFRVITTCLLFVLITYTAISYSVKETITKDKLKDYMFNISYTDSSINSLVDTYQIKDDLGYTDYLTELVVDEFLENSEFKDEMATYLTDIIYEDKNSADKEKINTIVNKNIKKVDSKNRINDETKMLMVNTITDYINDTINNTIDKNEKTTRLLNIVNHFLNVNIPMMLVYIFGCAILLILFTISLIRPIKYIGLSSLFSGIVLVLSKVIEGPIINVFIKGETSLLEASKSLVKELFNHWFTVGVVLIIIGIVLIIIYILLMNIFDKKTKKRRKAKKEEKKNKKNDKLNETINLNDTVEKVKKKTKPKKEKVKRKQKHKKSKEK